MLFVLCYRYVGKCESYFFRFARHIQWVSRRYPTVFPGEAIKWPTTLCLTFDAPTIDFYYYIFPLLERYHVKALIAVSPLSIPHFSSLTLRERLAMVQKFSHRSPFFPSSTLCTWKELIQLCCSPWISIVSRGVHQGSIDAPNGNPEYELFVSKLLLEEILGEKVLTFVYPCGKCNSFIHQLAKKHYPYIMCLKHSLNMSWYNSDQLIYRIEIDQLDSLRSILSWYRRSFLFFRYFGHRIAASFKR